MNRQEQQTLGGVGVGNETTLAGKLSRKQAKNLKQRMNKMRVM